MASARCSTSSCGRRSTLAEGRRCHGVRGVGGHAASVGGPQTRSIEMHNVVSGRFDRARNCSEHAFGEF
eukprot:8173865-Alexandrium_andersonii.AAC.1